MSSSMRIGPSRRGSRRRTSSRRARSSMRWPRQGTWRVAGRFDARRRIGCATAQMTGGVDMRIRAQRRVRVAVTVILVVFSALATAVPHRAFAAGGGGDDRASTPARADDPDYTAAVKAIKTDKFAAAIPLLEGVVKRDATNADAYNWLAYATRKNGDPAASIPIYAKA